MGPPRGLRGSQGNFSPSGLWGDVSEWGIDPPRAQGSLTPEFTDTHPCNVQEAAGSKADTAPSLRGDLLQWASDAEREKAPQHSIISEEGRGADANVTGVWPRVTQSDRVEQEGPQSLSKEEPEYKSLEKGRQFQQQRHAQRP